MKRLSVLLLLAAVWSTAAMATDKDDARVVVAQAQTAVQAAEDADAATAASTEMRAARDNLTAAQGAMQRGNYKASMMSAEKAKADANLATARARQKRATEATAQIEQSIETLRQQITQQGS